MLTKLKQIIYSNVFIFLIIFLIISPIILNRPLNNLDEIWNYNFARNMADGLVPYKDFNMVTTPLLPFICSIFLKIFGNELIIMRILACILVSFIFLMTYLLLKKLKVNFYYINLCLLSLIFIFKDHICIDYNFATLFFTLILIYLEIKYILKNTNYFNGSLLFHFFIGILSGACILLKQSTGIFICLACIIYPILFIKNKNTFKSFIKITFIRILGILMPILLLIFYLFLTHSFYDFIDYTILGIRTFTNFIPYSNLLKSNNIVIKIASIFMPIFIVISGIYLWRKKEKKLLPFYCYSIFSLIVIFPISDDIHFLIGFTPFIILFFYLFYNFLIGPSKKINFNFKIKLFLQEMIKAFIILGIICYLMFSIFEFNNYFNNKFKNHNIKHFIYISISEQLLNKINIIDNYILTQNSDVYILDAEAAIYMISMNQYHKDFDMFNKGNLGSKSEDGIIEQIKTFNDGTKILIKNNNYSKNWQTPMKVIHFVENNFYKIDEVSIFDIYIITNNN